MTLALVTVEEARQRLGFTIGEDGLPTDDSLAQLLLAAVERWGVARRQAVTLYAHRRLDAVDLLDDAARARVKDIFDALLAARDIGGAHVDGEAMLARVPPRVVQCGDRAFVWGTVASCGEVTYQTGHDLLTRLTRWLPAPPDQLDEDHPASAFSEVGLDSWLGAPGYLRCLARRRAEGTTLPKLWPELTESKDWAPIGDPASYRLVAGEPGAYFGAAELDARGARWRTLDEASPGIWCAARRGRDRDRFTTPTLCRIDEAGEVTALDLFDWDEWHWALLARGCSTDAPERIRLTSSSLEQTCPLPEPLQNLLVVTCRRSEERRWRWEAGGGVIERVARLLGEVGGLRSEMG